MPETPLRPLCFMVMPFGRKPVVPPAENSVATIDFDALWAKALEPVIRELGSIADLERSVGQQKKAQVRQALSALLERLKSSL